MIKKIDIETQALVIYLRFGSLNSDSKVWLSPTQVFKRTGVKLCTQWAIIRRWRAREFTIVKGENKGRRPSIAADDVRWIVARDTLESMAHLSLQRRVEIIREKLGRPRLSATTLRRYYVRNRVSFKRPDYKYYRSLAE